MYIRIFGGKVMNGVNSYAHIVHYCCTLLTPEGKIAHSAYGICRNSAGLYQLVQAARSCIRIHNKDLPDDNKIGDPHSNVCPGMRNQLPGDSPRWHYTLWQDNKIPGENDNPAPCIDKGTDGICAAS